MTLLSVVLIALHTCNGCAVDSLHGSKSANNQAGVTGIKHQVEKAVLPAATTDCFLADWQAKSFVIPAYTDVAKPTAAATATVTIDTKTVINKVSKYIFGNNSNPFSGQMVTEPVLMNNIKGLKPNILRFPGGDPSDVFFWNKDNGQTPTDVPPQIFISNGTTTSNYFWYGKNTQPWTLSVDNYYKMLQQTASTGIITVNYGYARYGMSAHPDQVAAHLAADWVRYDHGRTKFWEVGNEVYGYWEAGWKINPATNKDGQPQLMTGAIYGKHFNVIADSMRKAAAEVSAQIYIGAVLVCETYPGTTNPAEAGWNSQFFAQAGNAADFYITHSYYTPYGQNDQPPLILSSAALATGKIQTYLAGCFSAGHVTPKPLAMTEWNIFSQGSGQKTSTIAGVHAALNLGEMIKAKFSMASRFDILGAYTNGDDFASLSKGDEPDNTTKWNPRPVFFYMYYFQQVFGDTMVASSVSGSPDVAAYASVYSGTGNTTAAVIVNKGTSTQTVSVNLPHTALLKYYYYYVLQGDKGITFSRKVYVNGAGTSLASGGPMNYQTLPAQRSALGGSDIRVTVPPYGVVYLVTSDATTGGKVVY